jgi:hypothetical protein
MKQIIEHLQNRVRESKAEYARVSAKRQQFEKLQDRLLREIAGYEQALEAEMRRKGIAPQASPAPAPPNPPLTPASPSPSGHPRGAVMVAIIRYLREAGARGMSYKEIAEYLSRDKVRYHENYPYVVVSKLKKRRLLKDLEGRFYWQEPETGRG